MSNPVDQLKPLMQRLVSLAEGHDERLARLEAANSRLSAQLARIGEQVSRQSEQLKRGRLKIFFGMCPGVGKTYAMLHAARQRHQEKVEVLIGIVETHGRRETIALLEGLPIADRARLQYRGTVLDEMDLDGILTWHPQLVIVDELAHTNAPGSRR